MKYKLISVTNKTQLPASGDPHDYFSMAPYFWPNPDTPDGLPYVNRDGEVNFGRYNQDREWLQELITDLKDAAARFESGETEAEADAEALVRCFFLDSETKMNPNLNYAQAVLGEADGRGIGIIDLNDFPVFFDCIGVFPERPWKEELRRWMKDFLNWLLTSKNGRDECAMTNNHGNWYDTIVTSIAEFVGDEETVQKMLRGFIEKRVRNQLAEDGSFPLETARTRPLHYHIFTLYACARMTVYGDRHGVPLRDTEEIQRAWHFLQPYLHGEPFIKEDIVPLDYECPPRIAYILKTFEKDRPQDAALRPVHFTSKMQERFNAAGRLWQSAPGAAVTKGGRTFVVCSGDNDAADEKPTNYTVCAYSDNGTDYQLCFYAWHDEKVRVSETLLYMMPDGSLCHFWTQSYEYFDGRGGIWCAVCKDPDADRPKFGRPKRICDGFMAHTPALLRSGKLLFPASIWTHMKSDYHPYPDMERPSVWIGSTKLNDLRYLGGSYDDTPDYTENAVYEKEDGTLVMLWRSRTNGIVRAYSHDGGRTFSEKEAFLFPGPNSRFFLGRFPSGHLCLVTHYQTKTRDHLTALLSEDEGESFPYALLLDERSCSYPSGNISSDGRVTLAYDRGRTEEREILLASFCEEDIRNGSFGAGSFTKRLVFKGGVKGI